MLQNLKWRKIVENLTNIINDDEYFSHLVNEDIDRIIRDLREKHRKDSTSAPEVSVVQKMKQDLDEVANFKGSRLEK